MNEKIEYPSYFGIIPASVRYDKKLSMSQRVLYSELTALSNKYGYCNAKNSYFAKLYGVDKTTISRWVSKLEEFGHIKTSITYKPNSKQVDERKIYPLTQIHTPIDENINTPIDKNINTPIDENVKVINNTSNNNTRESNNPLPDFVQNNRGRLKKAMDEEVDFRNENKPTEEFHKFVGTDLIDTLNKYPAWTSLHKEDKKKHLIEFSQNAVTKYWPSKSNLADHIIKSLKYYKPTKEVYRKGA